MKSIRSLLALLLCWFALADHSFGLEQQAQAWRQQLLAERLGKVQAWQTLASNDVDAAQQSKQSQASFNKQLQALQALSQHDLELKEQYQLLGQLWHDNQTKLSRPMPRQQMSAMVELQEEFIWAAQRGGELVYERSKRNQAMSNKLSTLRQLAEIATLSQRLARIYLLRSLDVPLPFLSKDLQQARSTFNANISRLEAESSQSKQLRDQLQLMRGQWFFFQQAIDALAAKQQDTQLQRNVLTTSERIVEVADAISRGTGVRLVL